MSGWRKCFVLTGLGVVMAALGLGGILALDYFFPEEPDEFASRYSGMTVEAAVSNKELPERMGLSYSERVHEAAILTQLGEQRIQALVRGLPDEWVRRQFVAFESAEEKGLALDRSIGWGVGWYHGKEFRWFAYTSPDGWLQMNMSVLMNKQDMLEMAANRRLDARNALESDMPGTATHVAFRDGGTNWIEEFCLKDSSVCNTAGAFEKYFLSHANKAMPEKLLFRISSWFPY